MNMPLITAGDAERLLGRSIGAWAAAGVVLAAFWEVLLGALWLYALGFWIGYALAGAVLGVLAIRHRGTASSRRVGFMRAASVPVVATALWTGAGVLRAGGNALAAWVSAI
jgi:hypothetical protein